MTKTIHAVYENGVFRPTEQVNLPEHCEVEVDVRVVNEGPEQPMSEGLANIYAVLGERFHTGHTDTAARHNEHQP